ncbi:MAG: CPBP family intramembrane metalloprotease [Mediterranea massiliensis]|nr:CPBP family intramembrane metalloprotease [Mediterranea massiliensis]
MKTVLKLILIYLIIVNIVLMVSRRLGVDGNVETVVSMALTVAFLYAEGCLGNAKRLFTPPSAALLGWSLPMGISFCLLLSMLMEWLPALPDWYESDFKVKVTSAWGIVVLVFLAPLFEELFFRKALTDALLKSCSPLGAILCSGLLFGAFHLNPAQAVPALIIGVLLAWIYYTTQSLLPTFLIHMANNAMAVWVLIYYPDVVHTWQLIGWPAYWVLLTASLLLFVVSLRGFRRATAV